METMQSMQGRFRSAMGRVANQMFPIRGEQLEKLRLQSGRTGLEYATFLPLQMAYYFNAFYAPFWAIGCFITLIDKFSRLDTINQPIAIALFSLYCLLELIRLYIGYFGNLAENIADLAGSWLITTIIQLPAICFFLFNPALFTNPFERVLHIIELIFVFLEVCMGLYTIKVFQTVQALKFHHKMEYYGDEPATANERQEDYVYFNSGFEATEMKRRSAAPAAESYT